MAINSNSLFIIYIDYMLSRDESMAYMKLTNDINFLDLLRKINDYFEEFLLDNAIKKTNYFIVSEFIAQDHEFFISFSLKKQIKILIHKNILLYKLIVNKSILLK